MRRILALVLAALMLLSMAACASSTTATPAATETTASTETTETTETADIPATGVEDGVLTVGTGVSGSGKSSRVTQILYPELRHYCSLADSSTSAFKHLYGNLSSVKQVEFVDQNPIGKSTRSNPVTYIKAYEEIRKLMSSQPLAKQNNYTSAFFSFNAPGGRCEACQGEGNIKIEMQFMADVVIQCDQCHGKRFKDDILEVKYRDKNIYDILDMTVNQAIEFFSQGTGATEKKIVHSGKIRLCVHIISLLHN